MQKVLYLCIIQSPFKPKQMNALFRTVPKTKKEISETSGYQTISVTPETAARWLAYNESNRPLNKKTVLKYLETMKRGKWQLNGQMIIFSSCGVLLDGQHRLSAVVSYGQPVLMDVRFGIDIATYDTIDDGKKRSPGDILGIAGIKNSHNTAAAIRVVMSMEMGYQTHHIGMTKTPTNEQIVNWYNENPGFYDFVAQAENWYHKSGRLIKPAGLAAFYWMFSRRSPAQAFDFLNEVMLGVGLSEDSPAYTLRSLLIREAASANKKTSLSAMRAMIIKAWNAYREGRKIKLLRYRPNEEEFPKIK